MVTINSSNCNNCKDKDKCESKNRLSYLTSKTHEFKYLFSDLEVEINIDCKKKEEE